MGPRNVSSGLRRTRRARGMDDVLGADRVLSRRRLLKRAGLVGGGGAALAATSLIVPEAARATTTSGQELGYAEITTAWGTTSSTNVNVPGLSFTFEAGVNPQVLHFVAQIQAVG